MKKIVKIIFKNCNVVEYNYEYCQIALSLNLILIYSKKPEWWLDRQSGEVNFEHILAMYNLNNIAGVEYENHKENN